MGGPTGEGLAVFTGIRAARAADKIADAGKVANRLGDFKGAGYKLKDLPKDFPKDR